MFPKTVSMTFFNDHCAQNVFFIGEPVYLHSIDYIFYSDL